MWKPVNPPPTTTAPTPAASCSALERCCAAYRRTLAAAGGPNAGGALNAAEQAYRNALPFLIDRPSIFDFIASVTHGMVLRVFWVEEGPKLLSAARTALAAIPPEPRRLGRPPAVKKPPVPEN
jgi:hypothetical protein